MSGGPEPQRFAENRHRRAHQQARAGRRPPATARGRPRRTRAGPAFAQALRRAGPRRRCVARHRVSHAVLPPAAAPRRPALRRPECRAGTAPCRRRPVAVLRHVRRWWHSHTAARDDGLVFGQPRTVALGPRRTVQADDRRAHRRADVRRPRVAGHHDARAARQRDDVGDRRRRRQAPRRPTRRRRLRRPADVRRGPTAPPTSDRDARAKRSRQRREPLRRPAFVRPGGARIEERVASARGRPPCCARDGRLDVRDRKLRSAGRRDPAPASSPRLICTTCRVSSFA